MQITDLSATTTFDGASEIALENGGITYKATGETVANGVISLAGLANILPHSGYSFNQTVGCYGFVTTNSTIALLYAPIMLYTPSTITLSSSVISTLTIDVRTVSGSYLMGASYDARSLVNNFLILGNGCGMRVRLDRSAGFGVTNNTPLVGTMTIAFTIS